MARGPGLATKGMGVAYGFIGFIGGLVVDYAGRLAAPAERTSTEISTLDMIELGGLALLGLVGYFSPKNAQWIPISQGLMTGKLYATLWGPRLFRNRYILTTITGGGQLVGYEGSQFGGSYRTENLSTTNYPVLPIEAYEGMTQGGQQQFANLGPVGDPDLSDIYDVSPGGMV